MEHVKGETKRINTVLIPIFLGFFVMGFVDIVGVSTSYVKADFDLKDTIANLLPMLVFLWFAIFSLPTSLVMGTIGRKNTVLLSLSVTLIAVLLPLFSYTFTTVLLAFALLGIGNTMIQVSLNPLLIDAVKGEQATSKLTLGQFIKAISSALGPILAAAAANWIGGWYYIFPVYAIVTLLSWMGLRFATIQETAPETNTTTFKSVGKLICSRKVLAAFLIILLLVGFEVGLMTVTPKYLLESAELPIKEGGLGCSLYFLGRIIGTFSGSFLLIKCNRYRFLVVNIIIALAFFLCFMIFKSAILLFIVLFFLGLFCANVFPIVYAIAIQSNPKKANEISALLVMGIAGGAIMPIFMGLVADTMLSQWMSLFPLLIALVLMLYLIRRVK
jgi:fucose permease